jgi:hypothetical protein
MYAFDWANDPQLHIVKLPSPWNLVYDSEYGPDAWFCELCDRIAAQVREHKFDGANPVAAIREAIASGHGIGKSAGVGMLVNWVMSTRPFAQGTVTATTNDQLRSKTWAQIGVWNARSITGHWFEVTSSPMRMRHRVHSEAWKCEGKSCDEHNSEAFAGQHAANSTPFYIFDESSGVPDTIYDVSVGGLTDGEPMVLAFGNPTMNTGWFAECFRSQRHRWNTQQIDSRDVQITNKKYLQELIDDYGIDSDRVKVRVRGMFPALSAKQYIAVTDLDAAYGRHLDASQYVWAPKILTLDPAWEGDDEMVFGLRQGLHYRILRVIGKNDNDLVVAKILADLEDEHRADAVFVDAGYGTGIVSAGRTWNRDWTLVWFAGESSDPGCINKRSQMFQDARNWMKAGGAIPKDTRMYNEALSIETVPRMDGKLQIESKIEVKKRMRLLGGGGESMSPNRVDSLVLSFAFPVQARDRHPAIQVVRNIDGNVRGHDPYSNMHR